MFSTHFLNKIPDKPIYSRSTPHAGCQWQIKVYSYLLLKNTKNVVLVVVTSQHPGWRVDLNHTLTIMISRCPSYRVLKRGGPRGGVFLGNPEDSVWEDWGTLGNRED